MTPERESERSELEVGDWTLWLEFERGRDVTIHVGTVVAVLLVGYIAGRRAATGRSE